MSNTNFAIHLTLATTFLLIAICVFSRSSFAQEEMGTLQLTITDTTTGEIVPARVEIRGSDGAYHIAEDALLIGGDCGKSNRATGYVDLATTLAGFSDRIVNPYTSSTQFYSNGHSTVRLPKGSATIKIFKGPEFKKSVDTVRIRSAKEAQHNIKLSRWINMPKRGWYSADDHLHIPRPDKALNPYISQMMQAEDIHVANLLQMGSAANVTLAAQHAHGPAGHYQEGDYILAAGQENPRTHFLGHAITLGADAMLHDPEKYLIFRLLWEQAAKQGALNGFAHANMPYGRRSAAHDGMAVLLPHNLLNFLEVLQFNRSDYSSWYDVLALGFQVAPTAGTDYPCLGQNIPGHERFYTKVQGDLTYDNWLEGVRSGRTFVTTGPMVNFRIDGQDMGSEIVLDKARAVKIKGSVVFDTDRDAISYIELVHNGNVIKRFSRTLKTAPPSKNQPAEFGFTVEQWVDEASWFALRGYGENLQEKIYVKPGHFNFFPLKTNVHSAPIYVTVKNLPGIEKSAHSKAVAQAWLARLEDMEAMLAKENIDFFAKQLEGQNSTAIPTAIPKHILVKNRAALRKEVRAAKRYFKKLSQPEDDATTGTFR